MIRLQLLCNPNVSSIILGTVGSLMSVTSRRVQVHIDCLYPCPAMRFIGSGFASQPHATN